MTSVSERLAMMFADPGYRTLARSILGTDDPKAVAARLDEACRETLGARISVSTAIAMSVGAVFELTLHDGREVALKVHGPDADPTALAGAYQVMHALAERGVACPKLLHGPLPFEPGTLVVMTRLPAPAEFELAVDTRRAMMAHALAELIGRARPFAGTPGLPGPRRFDAPWPVPHNVLFDFEGTRAGAEWIDTIGTATAAALEGDRGERVVGHCDWSAHNVRCTPAGVAAIYDGDSLRVDGEPVFAGNAAITCCLDARSGFAFDPPSPEDALAFLDAYEQARGQSFSPAVRRIAQICAVRQIAYIARCQYALRVREGDPNQWPMERALRKFEPWLTG